MDRVYALLLRQRDDAVNIEIGLHGAHPLSDLIGFVGLETVQAEAVLFGVNRHGTQPQLGRRAHDADGNLAAVER